MDQSPPECVAQAKRQLLWLKLFYAHAALFAVVNATLFVINLATGMPPHWWAYVLWGWGILLMLDAGITFPRLDPFVTHALLFAIVNAGLITINVTVDAGYPWSLWVLASTAISLLAHIALRFRMVDLLGAHAILTVLVLVELGVLYLLVRPAFDLGDLLRSSGALIVPLIGHALIERRAIGFYAGHILVWMLLLATLTAMNVTDDSGIWWVQYPFVVGVIVLAAHTLVRFRVVGFPDSEWESTTLARLHAQAGADDEPVTIEGAVRARRGLLTHLFCFGVGVVCFLVLNLMSTPEVYWSVWPISVWIGLLMTHAGAVVIRPALFGMHVAATLALALGLTAINLGVGGERFWAMWPIGALSLVLAVHAALVFGRRRVREWEEDRLSRMLN